MPHAARADASNAAPGPRLSEGQLRTLVAVSRLFAGAPLDEGATLETICREIAGAIGDGCIVRLLSGDGQVLLPGTGQHRDPQSHAALCELLADRRQPADEDPDGRVIRTGEPVVLGADRSGSDEPPLSPGFRVLLRRLGAHGCAVVPLRGRSETLGTLTVVRDRDTGPYTAADLVLLLELAERAALAIENARLYALARRAERESQETAAQLARQTAELARSNRELELFAYVASHDLQEPLRMVASYTQLLARRYRGQLGEEADEFIGFAVDGANRMRQLIQDMLAYSRVGTRGHEFEAVDCDQVADRVIGDLATAIAESGATVTHEPLPTVSGDPTQLRQLFQNLVGNALKYRRPDVPPAVQIGAARDGAEWHFTVRDNGIGIAPEYAERVFVIFQRLHTQDEYSGTGIGLAICKKIVERHGGRIWVESAAGAGATFHFTLPEQREAGK